MRTYTYIAMRPGSHFDFWPPHWVACEARIRVVAAVMFRKYFGRAPDALCWHKDGFMAECSDRRGFCLQVEQVNHSREQHKTPPRYSNRRALALVPAAAPFAARKELAA